MQSSVAPSSMPGIQGPRCTGQAAASRTSVLISCTASCILQRPRAATALGSCLALGSRQQLRGAQPRGLLALSQPRCRGGAVVVRAESVNVKERAVSALPYLVPMFDSLRYGKFAMVQTPIIYKLLAPLDPFIQLYTTVPFASLAVFFAIYAGIINQRGTWSRYVRFNAMQAILLDIILILPGVFENVFKPPMSGFGLTVYINGYNSIFFFVLACWLYATGACLLGNTPRLPLVADAADQQVPY